MHIKHKAVQIWKRSANTHTRTQTEWDRERQGSERVHLVRAIKNGHLNWSGSLPGSVLIFRRMCAMSKATFDKWSKGVAAQQPSPSPAEAEQEHVYLSFILFLLSPSLWCVCICYLNIYAIFIKKIAKKSHAQLPDNSFYQLWKLVFLAIFSFCSWIVSHICLLCCFIYIVAFNYLWSDETWV